MRTPYLNNQEELLDKLGHSEKLALWATQLCTAAAQPRHAPSAGQATSDHKLGFGLGHTTLKYRGPNTPPLKFRRPRSEPAQSISTRGEHTVLAHSASH